MRHLGLLGDQTIEERQSRNEVANHMYISKTTSVATLYIAKASVVMEEILAIP